jgi:hypothetical protein
MCDVIYECFINFTKPEHFDNMLNYINLDRGYIGVPFPLGSILPTKKNSLNSIQISNFKNGNSYLPM